MMLLVLLLIMSTMVTMPIALISITIMPIGKMSIGGGTALSQDSAKPDLRGEAEEPGATMTTLRSRVWLTKPARAAGRVRPR